MLDGRKERHGKIGKRGFGKTKIIIIIIIIIIQ
jgi:hypothetical protein